MSTRGVTLDEEGFIHCSRRHQLRAVADLLYSDADDVVMLVIDSEKVTVPIRDEPGGPGGEVFPHIYGALPAEAVTNVIVVGRDSDGRLVLPGE
jgi:uncharacterized protein (DUF952 family)